MDDKATPPRDLSRFRIDPDDTALLIVDFQERLAAVMPEAERIACERHISLLIEMARRQSWPVVVSQQYPTGLGAVVAPLATALQANGLNTRTFDKTAFSCCAAEGFDDVFASVGRTRWVVVGMEAHICVFQTVRDLLERGCRVHVAADAVISRKLANKDLGLRLMRDMGAVITATETVLFDALADGRGEDFKAISRLVR